MSKYFGFEPYVGDQPFVFISYKSEESDTAATYAQHLKDNGINVYYDAALEPGVDWAKKLLDTIGLPNCMGLVLMVSVRSLESQPVIDEVKKAHYSHKSVLAVYIENVPALVEPMKTYLSGTHSVFAWTLPEEEAKKQVLTGAVNLLSGDKTPVASSALADELWKTAQFFLINARRSKSDEDIASAQKQYRLMTEQHPTDYRGWLGLAVCECMLNISSLDDAPERLGNAAKYYSYVVSAGCDAAASPEYTQVKSELWRKILAMISTGMEKCDTLESAQKFRTNVLLLNHRFGHTTPEIEQQYNALLARIDEVTAQYEKAKRDEADEAKIAEIFEWKVISTTEVELVRVKSKNELTGDLAIPKKFNGRLVRAIGHSAFSDCTGLTSITIPNSVTSIGDCAFWSCSGLTSITIPNSVASIGEGTFACCTSLTSINISNGNKSYCDVNGVLFNIDRTKLIAYHNAYSKEYTIPDSVTSIGKGAFGGCRGLTSITIPNSVTSIGEEAFRDCDGLTSITIPNSVKSIERCTFYCCDGLTSITINNANTSIYSLAFHNCPNLTIYCPGGIFSPVRKYAKEHGIKYKKTK